MRNRALMIVLSGGLALTAVGCNTGSSSAPTTAAPTTAPTTTAPPTTKPTVTLPGGITLPPGVTIPDFTIPPGATLPPNAKLPNIDPSQLPKLPPGGLPNVQFPEPEYPTTPDPNTPGVKVQKGPDATVYSLANDVSFDFNSDKLKPQAQESLKNVAQQLNSTYANRPVEVRGHADNRGNADYNKELSLRRANNVKAYLVSLGVAEARIKTIGFGSTVPVDTNDTPEGRAHNRRVEVLAVAKK